MNYYSYQELKAAVMANPTAEERNAKDKPSLLSIFAKMEKLMTQF